MTSDSSARVWEEAQRLLDERGTWTTDGGAYLETDQVTILVHPVFDDRQDRDPVADTVDLVITVRPRQPCELPPGAGVSLVGGTGAAVVRPLSARGQALFRRLPAGAWRARLLDDGPALLVSPPAVGADVIPFHTIRRLLAPAAGDRPPAIYETYTTDGRLTTEVVETPEARLVVRISAVDPPRALALVRVRWAVVAPQTTERSRTLVVPLARSEHGPDLVAKYDLGSLDQVEAVKIGAAEWADPSELTVDLVRQAFEVSLYGTARRAWEHLATSGLCPHAVEAVLLQMLER